MLAARLMTRQVSFPYPLRTEAEQEKSAHWFLYAFRYRKCSQWYPWNELFKQKTNSIKTLPASFKFRSAAFIFSDKLAKKKEVKKANCNESCTSREKRRKAVRFSTHHAKISIGFFYSLLIQTPHREEPKFSSLHSDLDPHAGALTTDSECQLIFSLCESAKKSTSITSFH